MDDIFKSFKDQDSNKILDEKKLISDSGIYSLIIENNYSVTSSKGTTGLVLHCREQQANKVIKITLWLTKSNGNPINIGLKHLHGLFAILPVSREAKETLMNLYDPKISAKRDQKVWTYPQLNGKTIGVVLQQYEYETYDGEIATGLNPLTFFDVEDGRTYNEIHNRKEKATEVDEILKSLKDKTLKESTASQYQKTTPEIDPFSKGKQ